MGVCVWGGIISMYLKWMLFLGEGMGMSDMPVIFVVKQQMLGPSQCTCRRILKVLSSHRSN